MKKNGKIYFPKLESEITRREILKKEIIELLGIDRTTFTDKLNGERPFTFPEALAIWKTWFSDIPIEELFSPENKVHDMGNQSKEGENNG